MVSLTVAQENAHRAAERNASLTEEAEAELVLFHNHKRGELHAVALAYARAQRDFARRCHELWRTIRATCGGSAPQ